jgi:lysophospholipase L1-like esterase
MQIRNHLRALCAIGIAAAFLWGSAGATATDSARAPRAEALVGTWGTSPHEPGPIPVPFANGFSNQTIRQIVHVSVGGDALRLRLTNVFGTRPVTFDSVYVGLQASGASVVPRSNRPVAFGGRSGITIAAGAEALSDVLSLRVESGQNLVVSLFARTATGTATMHAAAFQTNYVATGDLAANESGTAFTTTTTSWYFLDAVDVVASQNHKGGTIVAVGDSITDGFASTVDTNRRWPDFLAQRLRRERGGNDDVGVVNQGINGNRVLNDSACFGVNAQARLDRDVLTQDGLDFVILLEGINDIGFSAFDPSMFPPEFLPCIEPRPDVSAQQIIAGYQQIIARVHARGARILGGTLLPFKGAGYYTDAGEAKRQAVNTWIRTSGEFDGVIDFDRATRDPADPLQLRPAFDSGDHLHPSDAGYEAMASAIDLRLFHQD